MDGLDLETLVGPADVVEARGDRRIGPDGLEIGYWIRAGYTRLGYATEVARALIRQQVAVGRAVRGVAGQAALDGRGLVFEYPRTSVVAVAGQAEFLFETTQS